ncbi:MAG: hypothetical protein OJF49_000551 [Ktedonobacterales bacterium]|jgi:hypothetical protein|nr:MAG: hypothetical protein OJF49_000551 [Ktedonobacterales bacterium]
MIERYTWAFSHVLPYPTPEHWTRQRQHAPHKPLLLLCVASLVAEGLLVRNFIAVNSELQARFNAYWTAVTRLSARSSNLVIPFFHLADDGFWHLLPAPGMRRELATTQTVTALGQLHHLITGARLDDALFALLGQEDARQTLRRTLIETYFSQEMRVRLLRFEGEVEREQFTAEALARRDAQAVLQKTSPASPVARGRPMAEDDQRRRRRAFSMMRQPDHTAKGAAMPLIGQATTLAPGGDGVSISLLPDACIGLLDELASDWRRTIRLLDSRAMGSLEAATPLELLALAATAEHNTSDARPTPGAFWAEVVTMARAMLRPALAETLAPLLVGYQSPVLSGVAHVGLGADGHPQAIGSALFYALDDVLAAPWVYHRPLLSPRFVAALRELNCALDTVPLEAALLPSSSSQAMRTYNVLYGAGMRTVGDVARLNPDDLCGLRNFGPGSFRELCERLLTFLLPWIDGLPDDLLTPPAEQGDYAGDTVGDVEQRPTANLATQGRMAKETHPLLMLLRSPLLGLLDRYGVAWRELRIAEVVDAGDSVSALAPLAHLTLGELCDTGGSHIMNSNVALSHEEEDWLVGELCWRFAQELAERALAGGPEDEARLSVLDAVSVEALLYGLVGGMPRGKRIAEPADALPADPLPREFRVLFARCGVFDGHPKTLNELGAEFYVTRERARQLEVRANERLAAPTIESYVRGLCALALWAVRAEGGIATATRMAERIAVWLPFGGVYPVTTVALLASWSPALATTDADVYVAASQTPELVEQVESTALRLLEARPGGIEPERLIAESLESGGEEVARAGRAFVTAVLTLSTRIQRQGATYVSSSGSKLLPRLIAALRDLGHPAHFSEIAARYRALFPEDSERNDHTVHAFMGRFPETFVLVGHGMFALAEDDYNPALCNVASVVEHVLAAAERPLHRDEVIARASERYRWKENSLSAALATDSRIKPFGNGYFGLVDRDYSNFDSAVAYTEKFGVEPHGRAARVVGAFTNEHGHRVVQMRLTEPMLTTGIGFSNKPTRELFPRLGHFAAVGVSVDGKETPMALKRGASQISGLGAWFTRVGAQPGDMLFVEMIPDEGAPGGLCYRLAHAPVSRAAEVVGAGVSAGHLVLRGTRQPEKLRGLILHTLARPWAEVAEATQALGYVPGRPQGNEYLRLGTVGGLLATAPLTCDAPAARMRPTPRGRAWLAAAARDPQDAARTLALSLPAYRTHLRAEQGSATGDAAALLDPALARAWDARFGLGQRVQRRVALDGSSALIATADLSGPALAALLLLLAAQSQGQGFACAEATAQGLPDIERTITQLRLLGVAIASDSVGCVALDERVDIAVHDCSAMTESLGALDGDFATALGVAWLQAQQFAWPQRAITASDLYAELLGTSATALTALLVPPPPQTSDAARFADGQMLPCAFPALIADVGWVEQSASAVPFAFLAHADRLARGEAVAPLAVCLSAELLAQPWDAPRTLAANAHLALLTLIAYDSGALAEQVRRADDGWRLGGLPLISALDAALRALGYETWDEAYRDDPALVATLGDELVLLALRLGLARAVDETLEAAGTLANQVYYAAYDTLLRLRAVFDDLPPSGASG